VTQTAGAVGITIHGVSKVFEGRNGGIAALEDVTLRVDAGEFVCIVGPSGCGKSTLLKTVAGIEAPTSGTIRFDGSVVTPRVSMVFQGQSLFPWMSLLDNVGFGLEARGTDKEQRRARAHDLLDQLGLSGFAGSFPHELSGGMQQRAAIARAMLTHPHVLLMDEPFSALDAQSKLVMTEELARLWKRQGQTVLYVTHDIEEAVSLGDRILVMTGRPGRVREIVDLPDGHEEDLRDRSRPEVREITWRIWKAIEGQVRRNLHIPS
jgi:NitT/TauT family transport system ATP-binding protein